MTKPTKNFKSVSTDGLAITNEALVEAEKTTNQSYSSANNWVTLTFDNEVVDVTSDFASDQFTAPETGTYHIEASAYFSSLSDGDRIRIRFRDVTAGNNILRNSDEVGGPAGEAVGVSGEKELTGGNKHEVQIRNQNSDCTILGEGAASYLTITRSEEN